MEAKENAKFFRQAIILLENNPEREQWADIEFCPRGDEKWGIAVLLRCDFGMLVVTPTACFLFVPGGFGDGIEIESPVIANNLFHYWKNYNSRAGGL